METATKVKDVGVQWEPPDPVCNQGLGSVWVLDPGQVQGRLWPSAHREVGVQCDQTETTESGVQVDLITHAVKGPYSVMQLQCVSVRPEEHRPKPRPRGRPRLNRDQTGTKPQPESKQQTKTGPKDLPDLSRPQENQEEPKTWTRTRQVRPSRRFQDYELEESPERKRRRRTEEEEDCIGDRGAETPGGTAVVCKNVEERRNGHNPNWTLANPSAPQGSVSNDASVCVKEEAGLGPLRGVVCDICGKVLRNKSSLTRHSLVHNGTRPWSCKYCPLRFNRKDNLRNHLRLLHPNGPAPRVKLCPSPIWLCHACGKTFSCRSRLKTHEEIHSGVKPFKCPLCPKAYMRENDLKHHLKTIHPEGTASPQAPPSLLCHLCGRSFSCKSLLSLHLTQKHAGDRPHKCGLCGRKFNRKHQLRVHSTTVHRGEEPYSATVHRGEELQDGEQEMECGEGDGDTLVCDTCGRRLKSASLLATHVAAHHREKPFPCEDCGRSFVTVQSLSKHQRHVHINPKPARRAPGHAPLRPCSYPCGVCGRVFKFRSLLLAHSVVHSEERPFQCLLCPRSFRRSSHLTRHTEALHPDGRPRPKYICPICGTDQKFSSKLQRHLLMHSGERPHACDRCSQTFALLGNLQQHQIRVHGARIQRRRRYESSPPRIVFSDDGEEPEEDSDGVHRGEESGGRKEDSGGELNPTDIIQREPGAKGEARGEAGRGAVPTQGGEKELEEKKRGGEGTEEGPEQILQVVVGEHNYGETKALWGETGERLLEGEGHGVLGEEQLVSGEEQELPKEEQGGETMAVSEQVLIQMSQGEEEVGDEEETQQVVMVTAEGDLLVAEEMHVLVEEMEMNQVYL